MLSGRACDLESAQILLLSVAQQPFNVGFSGWRLLTLIQKNSFMIVICIVEFLLFFIYFYEI